DLLTELQVAHPAGGAVSLLERQVSVLRERSVDLRHRLNSLLDNARNKDRLFEETKQLVLKLLEAQSLDQIVDMFKHSLEQDFQLDYASKVLIGNATQIIRLPERMVQAADAR